MNVNKRRNKEINKLINIELLYKTEKKKIKKYFLTYQLKIDNFNFFIKFLFIYFIFYKKYVKNDQI